MKHTIILTAFRSNLSLAENKLRNYYAIKEAIASVKIGSIERVKGYYREDIAETATFEDSFIVTVNSKKEVKKLRDLFCGKYDQDCILWLNGKTAQLIGNSWQNTIGTKLAIVDSIEGLNAYTIKENGTILTVK